MGTKTTKTRTTGTKTPRDHAATRLDAGTIARLETLRVHLEKSTPHFLTVRPSDAMRAAIARGLAEYEREMSGPPRAKALRPRAEVAPSVEVGAKGGE